MTSGVDPWWSSGYMIWAIDSSGAITYVGPEWDAFVMADGRLPIRERILTFVHEDDRAQVLTTVGDAMGRKLPFTCLFRILHKDGTYRRMLARGVPTLDPETGALVGMIGSTYEMSEGDLTVTSVGWTEIRVSDRRGLRSTVDRIADHLLVARAMAEQADEPRLVAITDEALRQVFAPFGFDPTLRQ